MLNTNRMVIELGLPNIPIINAALKINKNIIANKEAVIQESYNVDVADSLSRHEDAKGSYLPPELWDKILRFNLTKGNVADDKVKELIEMRKEERKGHTPRTQVPRLINRPCPCGGACNRSLADPCPIGRHILGL